MDLCVSREGVKEIPHDFHGFLVVEKLTTKLRRVDLHVHELTLLAAVHRWPSLTVAVLAVELGLAVFIELDGAGACVTAGHPLAEVDSWQLATRYDITFAIKLDVLAATFGSRAAAAEGDPIKH